MKISGNFKVEWRDCIVHFPGNQWSALIPPIYLPALPVLIHVAFAILQYGSSISFSSQNGKFPLHFYHIHNSLKCQVYFLFKYNLLKKARLSLINEIQTGFQNLVDILLSPQNTSQNTKCNSHNSNDSKNIYHRLDNTFGICYLVING